jgi:hypothetical protein
MTFGKFPNVLRMRTLNARSSWLTVPVTRANTPEGSIRAASPTAEMSRRNARRVDRLAPYRAATCAGLEK